MSSVSFFNVELWFDIFSKVLIPESTHPRSVSEKGKLV